MKKLLLVAYETRFAPCGGIAAVMNQLPGYLRAATGLSTSVITPFHQRIPQTNSLPLRPIGKVRVPFFGDSVNVGIFRFDDRWHWYFLDAQDYILPKSRRLAENDERFFAGLKQPYNVGTNAAEQLAILRRDALFFGVAVARVLLELGADIRWTLLMQDWQAATTTLALTGPNRNHNVKCFLTLHNSYDSGEVTSEELVGVGIDPADVPAPMTKSTVLGRAIPLLEKPIFTVSEQFAREFTEDIFQCKVMAGHLQEDLIPPRLVGVNNGLFTALAIPEKPALVDAWRRDYKALKAWKAEQKSAAVEALVHFTPTEARPVWGNKSEFLAKAKADADMPWFVLAGRDDTRQKGFDVAAAAINSFLRKSGNDDKAQFLLFPMPGDEGQEGLIFLRKLAENFQPNVLVLPFIFSEGYAAALRGAAFGVMPSLYEPFGSAGDFYLSGAVGIGRATGGLLQQIAPFRACPSFTPAVARLSSRWHQESVPATGFLYREPDGNPTIVADWEAFNKVKYLSAPNKDRCEERTKYRLFTDMAGALEQAIEDAIKVHGEPPSSDGSQPYFAMLLEGIRHLQRAFSWEWSSAEYSSYLA